MALHITTLYHNIMSRNSFTVVIILVNIFTTITILRFILFEENTLFPTKNMLHNPQIPSYHDTYVSKHTKKTQNYISKKPSLYKNHNSK